MCDEVLFVERSGELMYPASLRYSVPEAKGNRVLKAREELDALDPKPGDLSMARLKWGWDPMEGRTHVRCNDR